jgi:hypothetical protein
MSDSGRPLTPQWRDNPGNFPEIPPVPEPILGIADPALRQRAQDAWLCACQLRTIIDVWRAWFRQLQSTGDADPGAAMRLRETASACVEALFRLGADIPSFRGLRPEDVIQWLPHEPVWAPVGWQNDTEFLNRERAKVDSSSGSFPRLQGELMGLMNELTIAPSAALPPPHETPGDRKCRVAFGDQKLLLDGQPVPLDMTDESRGAALCLVRHLLAAAGDWRSSTELDAMEGTGPCREHVGVRWDRVRKGLPPCLRDLIDTDRRKGYRLSPAAWPGGTDSP